MTYNINFTLIDENPEIVSGYANFLGQFPNWKFKRGDILKASADALVSPANSYGDMQGGIDKSYLQEFGGHLEDIVKLYIQESHGGFLEIGKSQGVPINAQNYKFLICTPTMEEPNLITDPRDIYEAATGLFEELNRINTQTSSNSIKSVNLPGLGTGCGGLNGFESGKMLALAYKDFIRKYK